MKGLNKVELIGNIGDAPDVRTMQNGDKAVNFSLATGEVWKDQQGQRQEHTEWHRVCAYRGIAGIVEQYTQKGSRIYVSGKIKTRKYQDKQGQDRYITEIIAGEIILLDAKYSDQKPAAPPPPASAPPQNNFDDDQIPF